MDELWGIFFSCDQAALKKVMFFRPTVRLSLTHFSQCSRIVPSWHFQAYYHWRKWCPYKWSGSEFKVMVTEVKTQFSHFRTVTPIWIHIWRVGCFWTVRPIWIHWWLWNDAQSMKHHRRGALLFFQGHPSNFKVPRGKKSILNQIGIQWWLWNYAHSLK